MVAHALELKGISYVSLASAKKDRHSNLETFKSDPDCSVLLIILSTLGVPPSVTNQISKSSVMKQKLAFFCPQCHLYVSLSNQNSASKTCILLFQVWGLVLMNHKLLHWPLRPQAAHQRSRSQEIHDAGGAAGLTLTVADTIILMEPSLSISLEEQAAGRIQRLGAAAISETMSLLLLPCRPSPLGFYQALVLLFINDCHSNNRGKCLCQSLARSTISFSNTCRSEQDDKDH